MRMIDNNEMFNVSGGSTITGSLLSSAYKIIELIYNVGETLGSYIRRKIENKSCDI